MTARRALQAAAAMVLCAAAGVCIATSLLAILGLLWWQVIMP